MNYIVLDLEWNQSSRGKEGENPSIPFEIIEIGAIKLNDSLEVIGEFHELIRPVIYHEFHHITSQIVNMQMKELEKGRLFPEAATSFLAWCGQEPYQFVTWGPLDLMELQRNMQYYEMSPLSKGPMIFMDAQKLFALGYEDKRTRRALEYAVDYLELQKDIPFHRALSDAYYTMKVFVELGTKHPEVMKYYSLDLFHPPTSKKGEIKIQFDTYAKYISRVFADKQEAFNDREVSSSKCFLCHRNLKKRIRWFTANNKHYYCMAHCEIHGTIKCKLRIQKAENGVFIVKTTRFLEPSEIEDMEKRWNHAKEIRRRKKH